MNLSKVKAKEKHQQLAPQGNDTPATDGPREVSLARGAILIVLISVVIALGISWWQDPTTEVDPDQLLNRVRSALISALDEPDAAMRRQRAFPANNALLEIEPTNAVSRHSIRLLRCVALAIIVGEEEATGNIYETEIMELMLQIDFRQCFPEDLLMAARVFYMAGRLSRSDEMIATALLREEGRYEALHVAVQIRVAQGRLDEALAYTGELCEWQPTNPYWWQLRASVLAQSDGKVQTVKESIHVTRKLLEFNIPNSFALRMRLVDDLLKTDNPTEARTEFDLVKEKSLETVSMQPMLEAKLLYFEGNMPAAQEMAEKVLARDATNVGARLLKGRVEHANGQWESAIETLQLVLKSHESNPEVHYLLGQAYARHGEDDKSRQHLERHQTLTDAKAQIEALLKLVREHPYDATLREQIADQYLRIGNVEAARRWRPATE